MKVHTEEAYESYLEKTLVSHSGWQKGDVREWDKERALFPARLLDFIRKTQPEQYKRMKTQHGAKLEEKMITGLYKELDIKGMLHVLRRGFKFYGKTFFTAYFRPAHGLNPENERLYQANQLTVTRQVPCHPDDDSTVDMVFSINGLPVATCELKNPATGQTWKHAVKQYQNDRKPAVPLFLFTKRALVHFAVDTDEVYMTTCLDGTKTTFLPFNRGSHPGEVQCGAGNPEHPSGYRTGYFWEEIMHKDQFLDILHKYMFLETKKETEDDGKGGLQTRTKKNLIFPRYHQLDAVTKLVQESTRNGTGTNYLIQHSAGSGKTNSISWLAHRLSSLHDATNHKIYDCVIVISDRRVLDKQLQDAIYQIDHTQGVVQLIDQDSQQLAKALIDGTQIVVTTLQKFPFIISRLLKEAGATNEEEATEEHQKQAEEWEKAIAGRKYAVIVDEAHSGQSGETSRELKEILGAGTSNGEEAETNMEDDLNEVMESRGPQKNLSFYAFTATPKGKTLELFGREKRPFHIYSMRQAIEEGFILDVLKNYTTYKTFYKLARKIEDDPEHSKNKALKAFGKFMSLHPYNIRQKTEIIVEHFRKQVAHRLNGRAKAMLVTSSRLQAVRYMRAFEQYIKDNKYTEISPMVAFSGTVKDPETKAEYTEPQMNTNPVTGKSISESELPEQFKTQNFNILLVANKYQTGFDQPLLFAMYVDKRLDGVQAVQTLSRLNRAYPGKENPIVLDFVNSHESIYKAFKPYYDATYLEEETKPELLEQMKFALDQMQVYYWKEVEAFAKIFYKKRNKQNKADHRRMNQHLEPAKGRFKVLNGEERQSFRDKLGAYIRLYAFISQILPYGDEELEKLYSFGRFLLPHLPTERDEEVINPNEESRLQYYRLEQSMSGSISLEDEETYGVKSPTETGTGKAEDEKKPLSEIITLLNDRFGTNFTEEDRLFFEQLKEKAVRNEHVRQTATANSFDKFTVGIKQIIEDIMIQRMSNNDDIVTRYMENNEFQNTVFPILAREIYNAIWSKQE